MIRIQKILVPVDFSEHSKQALTYAISLGLQYKARMVLCHIVPVSVALAYAVPTESYAAEREEAEKAKEQLARLIPEECRERVSFETIVEVGDVVAELLGVISSQKFDLVVMGTHGRSGFKRLILGSVTERMLRKVSVPILTVSNLNAARELHCVGRVPLRRILYATDCSEDSQAGMCFAFDLANAAEAQLTVLHVLGNLNFGLWCTGTKLDYMAMEYVEEQIENYRNDSLKTLYAAVAREKETYPGVAATPMLVKGEPYREILRIASEDNVDMIVMNLHGKGRFERALLGSTAEQVTRLAGIPVLSVPTPVGSLDEDPAAVLSTKQ